MKVTENSGFDASVVSEYRANMKALNQSFLFDDEDESSEEYAHFYFVGRYEGKEVIYDSVLITLRLQHESELYEIAEHRAAKHFPQYKKITYEEDENGNLEALDPLEEEIGLYMAEVIMELEEEGSVKVKENLEIDPNVEFGVSLDGCIHVEKITPKVIEKFIRDFNEDNLRLDDTLYSFQTEDEEL